ncbi:hypothetical protein OUZ56_017460 [Daphnia magna]|uniref:Uncharacterized protein n=1 Tax=Daphnia magna TaxID=35525 RepID=A0ABR0ASX5_9CRUS|nr:hypothetical protein OUZ56_017460 [Daphnia magna]
MVEHAVVHEAFTQSFIVSIGLWLSLVLHVTDSWKMLNANFGFPDSISLKTIGKWSLPRYGPSLIDEQRANCVDIMMRVEPPRAMAIKITSYYAMICSSREIMQKVQD